MTYIQCYEEEDKLFASEEFLNGSHGLRLKALHDWRRVIFKDSKDNTTDSEDYVIDDKRRSG